MKLKKIREKGHYTQEYIAKRLGISIRAYSKIERGETQLTINRLKEISSILNVSPFELLSDEMTQKSPKDQQTIQNEEELMTIESFPMKEHYEETIAILKDQIETLKKIIDKMSF
ncbi:helix-turn-helix domain-containing protein [Flavobacterium dauae]|uniref:helix-turn-helix domain-containing protein n=1 Tax=Flavobacterium dauae TaxID=1563479 RepID=UPI00101D014C|nr:transcriptional regulator [Flavobacterium dauae]WLD23992.1 helix-turn-helix domain-containing protein [Flavobacterium dauae]